MKTQCGEEGGGGGGFEGRQGGIIGKMVLARNKAASSRPVFLNFCLCEDQFHF